MASQSPKRLKNGSCGGSETNYMTGPKEFDAQRPALNVEQLFASELQHGPVRRGR
jgi:hypothetical protein